MENGSYPRGLEDGKGSIYGLGQENHNVNEAL